MLLTRDRVKGYFLKGDDGCCRACRLGATEMLSAFISGAARCGPRRLGRLASVSKLQRLALRTWKGDPGDAGDGQLRSDGGRGILESNIEAKTIGN